MSSSPSLQIASAMHAPAAGLAAYAYYSSTLRLILEPVQTVICAGSEAVASERHARRPLAQRGLDLHQGFRHRGAHVFEAVLRVAPPERRDPPLGRGAAQRADRVQDARQHQRRGGRRQVLVAQQRRDVGVPLEAVLIKVPLTLARLERARVCVLCMCVCVCACVRER